MPAAHCIERAFVKFLDLLGKPVRFRRRPTPGPDEQQRPDPLNPATPPTTAANLLPPVLPAVSPMNSPTTSSLNSPMTSPIPPATSTASREQTRWLSAQMDEAALLFAAAQPDAALPLLRAAIAVPVPGAAALEQSVWWMLLALHEAQGRRDDFDQTALAFAQRFEASPPQWPQSQSTRQSTHPSARQTLPRPEVKVLRGRLDDSALALLTAWQQARAAVAELDLDLASVTAVDLAGCHAMLDLLASWHQQGMRVQLHPCDALLAMLRELIQAGRPDADDAGWRLLIELLRLAGDVERYEDACLAYSLTYEMSPPAAPPPVLRRPVGHAVPASSAFLLPAFISMPVDPLLMAIHTHVQRAGSRADSQDALLILDASRLQRIDFPAASPLMEGIHRLAGGKTVEWRDVSFLVSTLLQLTSSELAPRIINRKP